ncbi:Protein transport protein Sec24C [Hypsibius exemplaris]|uniref:Protein transport protein Sec24C n=1 Tax=Hypsibius exemplaris TaxID=2072580 RepID=A0A1W0XBY5_HYPEX|nr:Protein transport protein Sec24C [Hypsibius exemplaris]
MMPNTAGNGPQNGLQNGGGGGGNLVNSFQKLNFAPNVAANSSPALPTFRPPQVGNILNGNQPAGSVRATMPAMPVMPRMPVFSAASASSNNNVPLHSSVSQPMTQSSFTPSAAPVYAKPAEAGSGSSNSQPNVMEQSANQATSLYGNQSTSQYTNQAAGAYANSGSPQFTQMPGQSGNQSTAPYAAPSSQGYQQQQPTSNGYSSHASGQMTAQLPYQQVNSPSQQSTGMAGQQPSAQQYPTSYAPPQPTSAPPTQLTGSGNAYPPPPSTYNTPPYQNVPLNAPQFLAQASQPLPQTLPPGQQPSAASYNTPYQGPGFALQNAGAYSTPASPYYAQQTPQSGLPTPGPYTQQQQQPQPMGNQYPPQAHPHQSNPPHGNLQNFPMPNQPGGLSMMPPGPQYPGSTPAGGLGADGRPLAPAGGLRNAAPNLTNDVLPSVIDVLERDRVHNGGVYQSMLNPQLPPLVSTHARTVDCGNSVPEFLRSSLYAAPCTANLLKDSGIPFVLHMQPMAELAVDAQPLPIVYHGEKGPVRCTRCKAYMSPYMKFVEGGKKFQCPFCLIATEVPQEYFAYLDSEGRRVDIMQRAELCLGTYEFLATKEYCRNEKLPEPPAFIFMIDVSYRAISSGMVAQLCEMLRNELESLLPVEGNGQESKLRVGIATFSDSVHFFNMKAGLKQPSMMTVNDFSDMFVPLVDGFLVRLEESGQMFDKLLQEIPKIFADARQTDTILYPAIQAGMRALEAAGCPGKIFVFNFSLPVLDAPGKLKNRDNRELLGTDKEKTLLRPQVPDYTDLAKECVAVGCSVDLFLFPNSYIDVATLSEVSRLTGGETHKYAYYQADKDGHRFLWDLRRNLKRVIAFDAVMRVRTSAGIRPTDYFGNLSMPTTTEVHLASLDSDKVILAEIKHDDKLEDKSIVHIQVALLYTSLSAQRRVRVLNMALAASADIAELYRTAEIDVIMNFMTKNSIKGLYEFSPAAIREGLTERSTKILSAYRNTCSKQTGSGQLVLPETLKLLPLYTGCLVRSDLVSGLGAEVGADDRSWLICHLNSLSIEHSTSFLYPRFFVLNEPDERAETTPGQHTFRQIRSTCAGMRTDQAYLLENGVAMFLWLGSQLDPSWLGDVFGVNNLAQIDHEKGDAALSTRSSPVADELRRFITMIRNSRPVYMRLMIIKQADKMEGWFRRFLVEDQGSSSFQQSYVQYIYYLHNAIRDEVEK